MIGHASIDENGRAYEGASGDQTGKEVCVRSWYNGKWDLVLRAINPDKREIMAQACKYLCESNLVGYNQYKRNDLWTELEKINWEYKKLSVKTSTDCSAFITVLAKIAGIDVPRTKLANGSYNAPVISTMRAAFMHTGHFSAIEDKRYLQSDNYLLIGDILVSQSGHTALNLTNGIYTEIAPAIAEKSLYEIANKGIAGKWGVGYERMKSLRHAG